MNASKRSRNSLQRSVSSKSTLSSFAVRHRAHHRRVWRVELTDRNIVITGAGSGIGAAAARRFSREGPRSLVLADLDMPSVQAVADELEATAVQADVGREEDILALIDRAREVGGSVDVFFSNAGVPGPAGGPEASDDGWERAWRVNVMAHVWAARALLPGMTAGGDGYRVSSAS